jgi:hypothetical protein
MSTENCSTENCRLVTAQVDDPSFGIHAGDPFFVTPRGNLGHQGQPMLQTVSGFEFPERVTWDR